MPKKIRMLRDEIVSYGPQKLIAGASYDLPDGLAQYLVREGIAQDARSEQVEVSRTPANLSLDDMTRGELYALAQAVDLEGRSTMTRDELIAALHEQGWG